MNAFLQGVLEDVTTGVSGTFCDFGIDDKVRLEMRALWAQKLMEEGSVEGFKDDGPVNPDPEPLCLVPSFVPDDAPIPMEVTSPGGEVFRGRVPAGLIKNHEDTAIVEMLVGGKKKVLELNKKAKGEKKVKKEKVEVGKEVSSVNLPSVLNQVKMEGGGVKVEVEDGGRPLTHALDSAEDYILCQYNKVTRNKRTNKWTLHLADGVARIGGKDYVFQKALGETLPLPGWR